MLKHNFYASPLCICLEENLKRPCNSAGWFSHGHASHNTCTSETQIVRSRIEGERQDEETDQEDQGE